MSPTKSLSPHPAVTELAPPRRSAPWFVGGAVVLLALGLGGNWTFGALQRWADQSAAPIESPSPIVPEHGEAAPNPTFLPPGVANAPTPCTRTLEASNGERVCDLSGKWDAFTEVFGDKNKSAYPQLLEITQQNDLFQAVRTVDDPFNIKGTVALRGKVAGYQIADFVVYGRRGAFRVRGLILEGATRCISAMARFRAPSSLAGRSGAHRAHASERDTTQKTSDPTTVVRSDAGAKAFSPDMPKVRGMGARVRRIARKRSRAGLDAHPIGCAEREFK